jgi:transposase-like protein
MLKTNNLYRISPVKKKQRNHYPQELKDSIVKLITDNNLRVSEVAQNLGISKHTIHGWIRKTKQTSTNKTNNEIKKQLLKIQTEISQLLNII